MDFFHHRFTVAAYLSLALAGCANDAQVAEKKPNSSQPISAKTALQGPHAELSRRFLAAMENVRTAPIEAWEAGGLTAVSFLERDFHIQANAKQTIEGVLRSGRTLPTLVRENAMGLAKDKPVENKVDIGWLRKKMPVPFPLTDEAVVIFATVSAVSNCVPAESDYNFKFLNYSKTLQWPPDTEWVRYGLYSGFYMHRCVDEAQFRHHADPLLKPLLAWMERAKPPIDIQAYVLFALAAGNRIAAVPSGMLNTFLGAQAPDGSWPSEKLSAHPSNQAALGAYVIAAKLTAAGAKLPQTDFRIASLMPPKKGDFR